MSSILRALRTLPIYVVTGKTEYNTFGANAAVPCMDTGTLNDLLNAGGALGVTQITDITGLTAWKDYIPVQNETGRTVPFSYDANGYFPIKKTSGAVFSSPNSLLHFNGANNGTVFTDTYGNVWTRPGNAVTSTTQKKFGTAGLYGAAGSSTNGGAIQCLNATFNPTNQDFNIDFWWYPTSYYGADGAALPYPFWMNAVSTTYPPLALYFTDFNKLELYASSNGSAWIGAARLFVTAATISLNVWQHIEVSRTGSTIYLFVGGVQRGTYNIGTTALATADGFSFMGIRGTTAQQYSPVGYSDELRIQIGTGGHTAGFTPPVAEYA